MDTNDSTDHILSDEISDFIDSNSYHSSIISSNNNINNSTNLSNNSIAVQSLQKAIQDGIISNEIGEKLSIKYSKLHDYVLNTYRREKELLKKAKQLNNDLLSEKILVEKQMIRKTEELNININLEKEKDKAMKEVADCIERDTVITYEITELQREYADLLQQKENILNENAKQIEPEIKKLTDEISKLNEEYHRTENTILNDEKRKIEYTEKINILNIEQIKLQDKKLNEKKELSKLRLNPDRIKKQSDIIEKAILNLKNDYDTFEKHVEKLDKDIDEQNKKKKEAEDIQKDLNNKLEIHRETIEQRQRDVDHVKKKVNEERDNYHKNITKKVELDLETKNNDDCLRRENEKLNNLIKELDTLKKNLKKKIYNTDMIKSLLPNLKIQYIDVEHQIASYQNENKIINNKLNDIKQEVDIYIAKYLKKELNEKEECNKLNILRTTVKNNENELNQWILEDIKQNKMIHMLSIQREIKSKELSKAIKEEKDTQDILKMKELIIFDLIKKHNETTNRLKEFSKLYDIVKNERNKYVHLIQSSSQALAEMKEKIKILSNEVEVLRNESIAKDKALNKEKLAHSTAQSSRDGLRLDTNKNHTIYKQKQEQVEQQIIEIDKLNSILNNMEKEMIYLKKKYEISIESRNFTGIQLIDRNDELCILYEKSNIQENTLKNGEIILYNKEQEIRILNIKLKEEKRKIELNKKILPILPEYINRIELLKNKLNKEKEITEIMCKDLETPNNIDRWRPLNGEDPDEDQLNNRINILENRLNIKKEELFEKELILEEITTLSDKLRNEANDGKEITLVLAKKLNIFQNKIKDTARKMMATVSELSMFQATAMKLKQDKHEYEIEYDKMVQNNENNKPPTNTIENEYYKLIRDKVRLDEIKNKNKNINNYHKINNINIKTTAEARPNAYIPDDLGIPKPYGNLAPFKPIESGSTMRHIRLPEKKDIEI